MRFTIRDIIWLTLVVALILGWWIDRRATVERHRQLVEEAQMLQKRLSHVTFELSAQDALLKELSTSAATRTVK